MKPLVAVAAFALVVQCAAIAPAAAREVARRDMPERAAATATATATPPPALRVGRWALSAPALRLLQRVAAVRTPDIELATVAAAAVEDRVLGEHARLTVGDERLFDDQRVARTPDAAAEAALVSSITRAWRAPLAAAAGSDGGARFVVRRRALARDRLRALVVGTAPGIRLDDRLTVPREAALRATPLLDYRFDAHTSGTVTLLDVWRALTVQERQVLAGGDVDAAFRQAEERVRAHFVLHWATTAGGLDATDLAPLAELMADHERRGALARWLGAIDDGGYRSTEIERLRRAVTDDDVAAYYAAHPDAFPRIERVRARHVRCGDARCAQAAQAALVAGVPFEEVARRFSIEANGRDGGDLGWLDEDAVRTGWLAQVAFALPPGAPTAPLHEPPSSGREDTWQIVQVHERVTGRHPADSETVRFAVRQALAHERAVAAFAGLRHTLTQAADVDVDAALVGEDAAAVRGRAMAP